MHCSIALKIRNLADMPATAQSAVESCEKDVYPAINKPLDWKGKISSHAPCKVAGGKRLWGPKVLLDLGWPGWDSWSQPGNRAIFKYAPPPLGLLVVILTMSRMCCFEK